MHIICTIYVYDNKDIYIYNYDEFKPHEIIDIINYIVPD